MMEHFTIFRTFSQTKTVYMNKLTIALLVAFLGGSTLATFAQNDPGMKAMMAYATPGDVHKMLASSTGNWTEEVSMWMKPGAPPMTSKAEAHNEMLLGGRYLQTKSTGNFSGMPFEGIGVTGYDNIKKKFVSSWIDNMGTGMMYMWGSWNAATKSITFTGKMVDPMASGKEVSYKQVWKFIDNNHQVIEMYSVMNGKEMKTMEIKLTRK